MQRFAVQFRRRDLSVTLKFPRENGRKFIVVAFERVDTHQFGELEKISHASGALECLIEVLAVAGYADVLPKLFAQFRNFAERFTQSSGVARHATFVPEQCAELAMNGVERALAVYLEEIVDLSANIGFGFLEFRMIGRRALADLSGQVIRQCVGQHKVAIGQSLHECAGAAPVGAVVGAIRFTDNEETGQIAHQIVISPDAAHGVMHSRVNPHRNFIGVFAGDFVVDLEQISVTFANRFDAETFDGIGKIQIDAASAWTDTATFIANFLGRTRCDVARGEVAVARVLSFEVIIAVLFRDFVRLLLAIFSALRNPDPSIVAQRLGHQRELGLIIAALWNAGGMDLRETRVGEKSAFFISAVSRSDIATASVGRQIKNLSVSVGREHNGIRGVLVDLTGDQIARNDSLGVPVDSDEVEHLGLRKHLYAAGRNLSAERLITA